MVGDLCGRMYDARSDWVHGSPVALFSREDGGPDTDEQFREVFADDDAIRHRWSVPGT